MAGFISAWNKVQGKWIVQKDEKKGKLVIRQPENLTKFEVRGKYSSPEFVWNNTVGLTDITFLNSNKLGKDYENDMFVDDFGSGNLYHFDLSSNRTELSLKEPLNDEIANIYDEDEEVIFAKGFGEISDLQVRPDGYLYALAHYFGEGNCDPNFSNQPCIP